VCAAGFTAVNPAGGDDDGIDVAALAFRRSTGRRPGVLEAAAVPRSRKSQGRGELSRVTLRPGHDQQGTGRRRCGEQAVTLGAGGGFWAGRRRSAERASETGEPAGNPGQGRIAVNIRASFGQLLATTRLGPGARVNPSARARRLPWQLPHLPQKVASKPTRLTDQKSMDHCHPPTGTRWTITLLPVTDIVGRRRPR